MNLATILRVPSSGMPLKMSKQPFLLRAIVTGAVRDLESSEVTADEIELPAVVAVDADGVVRSGLTKITEVKQETTDDN